jgi:hypothetical protein
VAPKEKMKFHNARLDKLPNKLDEFDNFKERLLLYYLASTYVGGGGLDFYF